jgi:sugar-specific transcriptional regulator TrmB
MARTKDQWDTLGQGLVSDLRYFGLSNYEAGTFQVLVLHGELTAAELCNETEIQDSKIYQTLEQLERKGLISVQRGKPNRYRVLEPGEAAANLRETLDNEHREKLQRLHDLTLRLSTLYNTVGREEFELAFIVRGMGGIISKMRNIIKDSINSILIFVPNTQIWMQLEKSIVDAHLRGVKVEVSLAEGIEVPNVMRRFEKVKTLKYSNKITLLSVDDRILVNVRGIDEKKAVAIVSQEETMIRLTREFYDNPRCCFDC